jgi:type IV secretion system protein VirB4
MSLYHRMKRQAAVEDKMPKIGHAVSEHVTSFGNDRAILVIRLPGIPFESATNTMLGNRADSLNRILSSLGSTKGNRLSITTTLKRRRMAHEQSYAFRSSFMKDFSEQYLARFSKTDYFENSYYLSLVLKHDELEEGVVELEELGEAVMKALNAYDPEMLCAYERNGIMFSETYEFIGELINGVERRVPVTDLPGHQAIPNAWLHFGYDVLEVRSDNATKYAVCYDLKDLPKSGWGQINPLLTLPVEFTLTQSFGFLGTHQANAKIETQIGKLNSVQDKAVHQIDDLADAQALLAARELAFGDYHGALVVYGPTAKKAIENGTFVAAQSLNECGVSWMQATLSAPVTYFSQVPGASKKPRPSPRSTRTLASMCSMHNYSTGKARGNPIGDGTAVMPLPTIGKGKFDFNFHASLPDQDNTGEKFAGHTLVLGATGTGKTTLQLSLVGFLERFDPKIFALDLDRGMEIFIRNLGGIYLPLKAGIPTGLAPFELPPTEANLQFMYGLVRSCARDEAGQISDEDAIRVKNGVDAVYAIERVEDRVFSRLLENIPDDGTPNSLRTRLSKWCYASDGEFAWALDNVPNSMLDVTKQHRIGFDVTDFLQKNFQPTEPVLAYLFYLKKLMQEKGGLLVTIIEEFWLPAQYPVTQDLILKSLKTGRKIEEFVLLVSQSPEDAIASPIFAAIQQQTATKIYLPNPEAKFEAYEKCNLNRKEFDELQKLEKESRAFLIKQSNQSVFAKLDLYGMSDVLAVLSGTTDNIPIWDEVWAEFGPNVDKCMPIFQARRKGKKKVAKLDRYAPSHDPVTGNVERIEERATS